MALHLRHREVEAANAPSRAERSDHAESSASARTGRRSNSRKPNLAGDHIHTSNPLPDSSPWVRGIRSSLAQPHICVLGISRSSRHKRSATGAQRAHYRKKRKFELGRQPANTKLGVKRIHSIRVRGGNVKFRALRLDSGNFAWGSEHVTKKTRIIGVVRTRLFFGFYLGGLSLRGKWTLFRSTTPPTTNSSERTRLSRVRLSRSMLLHSASGTNHTFVFHPDFRPFFSISDAPMLF